MSKLLGRPLVAVDVGNSRMKLALFESLEGEPLPTPRSALALDHDAGPLEQIRPWLAPVTLDSADWWIGSVNRRAAARLVDWLRDSSVDRITLVTSGDLPLSVALPRPDMVGIDRLLNAVAVNRLRPADSPAVIADLGTTITVDLVNRQGEFIGGAILPGLGTSARAMHEFTDMLPLIDERQITIPPAALGTATVGALESGLYWSAIGAIRELARQLTEFAGASPVVYLTGGGADAVAAPLADRAEHVPLLTLAGIALAARGQTSDA